MKTAVALRRGNHVDEFAAHGRVYRWREGTGASARSLRHALRRDQLAELFARTIVPQMERRGATQLTCAGGAPGEADAADLRWMAWHGPGDRHAVWGLYAAARRLGASSTKPANDTLVLIAWGDGPVLAWADDRAVAHDLVRRALRVPPPWLLNGVCSGDPAFPVRVDRVGGPAADEGAGAPCEVVRPASSEEKPAAETANPVLALVRAWRKEHGREPFSV